MTTVSLATYTQNGQQVWSVTVGGCAATAHSDDREFHADYARAVYHSLRGPRRLVHWNGDKGEETVLEERP